MQRGPLGELAGAGLLFLPSPLAALRVGGEDCRAVFPSPLLPFLADGVRTGCGGRGRRGAVSYTHLAQVTSALNSLEKKGLLQRQPSQSDRRRAQVTLTEEGLSLIHI